MGCRGKHSAKISTFTVDNDTYDEQRPPPPPEVGVATNIELMLGQRQRRCADINQTLGEHLVLAEYVQLAFQPFTVIYQSRQVDHFPSLCLSSGVVVSAAACHLCPVT